MQLVREGMPVEIVGAPPFIHFCFLGAIVCLASDGNQPSCEANIVNLEASDRPPDVVRQGIRGRWTQVGQ